MTRTDTIDWSTGVSRQLKNPGSWRNSGIRENIPPLLKDKLDTLEKNQLKDALRVMKTLSVQYDFETGILAMTEVVKKDCVDNYSAMAIAARMLSSGMGNLHFHGPDLKPYDDLLQQKGDQDE